jgi:hypothetical protein
MLHSLTFGDADADMISHPTATILDPLHTASHYTMRASCAITTIPFSRDEGESWLLPLQDPLSSPFFFFSLHRDRRSIEYIGSNFTTSPSRG